MIHSSPKIKTKISVFNFGLLDTDTSDTAMRSRRFFPSCERSNILLLAITTINSQQQKTRERRARNDALGTGEHSQAFPLPLGTFVCTAIADFYVVFVENLVVPVIFRKVFTDEVQKLSADVCLYVHAVAGTTRFSTKTT